MELRSVRSYPLSPLEHFKRTYPSQTQISLYRLPKFENKSLPSVILPANFQDPIQSTLPAVQLNATKLVLLQER